MIELIRANGGRPLTIEFERAGARQTVTVTPRVIGDAPRIGANINPYEVRIVKPGPIDAVTMSVERNWEMARATVQSLAGLFTRETSVKQLLGPVAIADLTGSAASQGWVELFSLMATISLSLGLLNLMPIPVLDGGHIAILAHGGRGAPRLQHEGEGADAGRRLRAAAHADGDRDLQRPDAHRVDRAPAAVADRAGLKAQAQSAQAKPSSLRRSLA